MDSQRDRLHEESLKAFSRLFPDCEAAGGNLIVDEIGIPDELENRPQKYYHQFRSDLKY